MQSNLVSNIENNLEELLVYSDCDLNKLKNNIKEISIEYCLNYLYNESDFNNLIDSVLLYEDENLKLFQKALLNNDFTDDKKVELLKKYKEFVPSLSTDAKLKIVNDKDLIGYLRTDSDFKNIYSNIFNSIPDMSKVDKDVLTKVIELKSKYGLDINDITIGEIGKTLNLNQTTLPSFPEEIRNGAAEEASALGLDDKTTLLGLLATGSKYLILATMAYMVYNRTKSSVLFVFYKIYLDKLLTIFKSHEYFSSKVTNKLLKYEYEFQQCSDYGAFRTPVKITLYDHESFKLKTCFIKYIGSSFLFLLKNYKDYLKYKGIQIQRLDTPDDLLKIKDERIQVTIKNNLFNMNKVVNVFLDDMYKQRLLILFKLIISDNFDISRFEFDDFK